MGSGLPETRSYVCCVADLYSSYRTHAALKGQTPIESAESRGLDFKGLDFKTYRWQQDCRGLYETPTAA